MPPRRRLDGGGEKDRSVVALLVIHDRESAQ